jgi:hypothetical protein
VAPVTTTLIARTMPLSWIDGSHRRRLCHSARRTPAPGDRGGPAAGARPLAALPNATP